MKVHWTDAARDDLRAIHDYIAQHSPVYAQRMVDRLTRRSEQIVAFPLSGQVLSEYEAPQIREVIEGSYRLIYHIKPAQIDVLAIVHVSRQIV